MVEAELGKLLALLEALSKSAALATGDLQALHGEALRLVEGTERVILLRDMEERQFFNTLLPYGAELPPAVPLTPAGVEAFAAGSPVVGEVYRSPVGGEFRVPVALPVEGPQGEAWVLAVTVPTSHVRGAMLPAVPAGWVVGVGDRDGTYVARSELHEETTGKPGLPEYLEKVVGRSGTFTAPNFQRQALLAGYYRSDVSGWFYAANVPLATVQAPLWRSLFWIGAIGLVAMLLSTALAYLVGKSFAAAAAGLAARAAALGQGRPVLPLSTSVAEFAAVADALARARRALTERAHELEAVLETAPVAVWFTHDPRARQVIRNRFAAELMGLPAEPHTPLDAPGLVIDTVAFKDGRAVSREDRPLSRAMRGEETLNEEFAYRLPNGVERILLSSARPIRDGAGGIVGAVQISLDITERKKGEEQRKLLVNELNHRVKNTLAVVQSVAAQTLRSAPDLEAAGRALDGRLVSLGKAHDILTQESWSGAELTDLLPAALGPHAGLDRFRLSGEAVRLPPHLALSLALALHELATNALKHGALSAPDGAVGIAWAAEAGPDGRRLRLEWREAGGPPVGEPRRRGFGTRMLERILDAEPGGGVSLRFDPTGLVCVFEADLDPPGAPAAAA
ncbi:MAG TPA: HWE histidine kinase domain-containing protein [Mesorhizobium sp.]|nr:HWE histidine kinase domain-containing protein [Mesorhizobium sp.]